MRPHGIDVVASRSGGHPGRFGRPGLLNLTACLLFVLLVGGCAPVPEAGAGFENVRSMVRPELGDKLVRWDRGGAGAGAEMRRAVDTLLEDGLTADEAVQVALLRNRDLRAVYEELGIARADLIEAGLLRNPVFDVAVRFVEGGGGEVVEASVAQNFLEVFFIPARRRIQASRYGAVQRRVAAAVLRLAGRTRRGVYGLQADRQRLELLGSVVEATRASYEAARRMREAGNITQLGLDRERALYEEARLDLAEVQGAVRVSRERLNRLMGLSGDRLAWESAGRLPEVPAEPMDWERAERDAVAGSFDLAAAKRGFEALARRLGVVEGAALFPEAEAGADSEREADGAWTVGPMLGGQVPIFDFGQAAVPRARARLRRAYDRLTSRALEIRSRARALRDQVLLARRRVNHFESTLLPVRASVMRQAQLQHNAMQIGVFRLLEAKRQQIHTGLEYIRTLRAYWMRRSLLEQTLRGALPSEGQLDAGEEHGMELMSESVGAMPEEGDE